MIVTFSPQNGVPTPAFTSNVMITVASNVPVADYSIVITGSGADGIEHTCKYFLTVKPIALLLTHTLNVGSFPVSGVSFNLDGTSRKTPYSATLNEGAHTVVMSASTTINGRSYAFKNWTDGTTNQTKTLSLTGDMSITADYQDVTSTPLPKQWNLIVYSNLTSGVQVTVDGSNVGNTPVSVTVTEGVHNVTVPISLQNYDFLSWEDDSTSSTRTINVSVNKTITAYYKLALPLSGRALTPANAAQVKQIGQLNSDWANQIAWSPDGKFFAAATYHIDIYDAQTTKKVYTIDTVVWPNSLAFSPDSRLLVAGGSGGLYTWNVDGWGQVLSKPNAGDIACIAFSFDGKTLATGIGYTVKLIDITSGNELRTLPAGSAVMAVAFSRDGKTLASGGSSGDIKLWDPQSGQELNTLTGHTNLIKSLAFSPNSHILASASTDKRIMLWNATSGQQLRVIIGHTDQVTSVAFSPDGQLIASASWDLTVRLWDAKSGQQLISLTGHTSWISTVAFSPDGATLASGGFDQAIRLWGLG